MNFWFNTWGKRYLEQLATSTNFLRGTKIADAQSKQNGNLCFAITFSLPVGHTKC